MIFMKNNKRSAKNFKKRLDAQQAIRNTYLKSIVVLSPRDIRDLEKTERLEKVVVAREPKGMPGGRCNVTACQREDSAIFLNVGQIGGKHPDTGGCYYCVNCARNIHKANERYSDHDQMTLFPMYEEMMDRYHEIWDTHDGLRVNDIANYADINQNPWGSCHHFDRDKYLSECRAAALLTEFCPTLEPQGVVDH